MTIIATIASIFGKSAELSSNSENNLEANFIFKIIEAHKPSLIELQSALNSVSDRDCFRICCRIEALDDSYLTSTDSGQITSFLDELETKLSLVEAGDDVILEIRIEKKSSGQHISVYSIKDLVDFWSEGGIVSSFAKIQDLATRANTLCVYGLHQVAHTNSLTFAPYDYDDSSVGAHNEGDAIRAKRDKAGHFANASQYSFIPEDFFLFGNIGCDELYTLLAKLRAISSLVFLCDFSKFDENGNIHLRLGGYRLFSKDILRDEPFLPLNDEYYDIYKWVYGDGDVIDKVGLARNIISLHLAEDNLLLLQTGTLQSISSGYQIYLKDNVKQYIEIKNKLSEFIQDSSDKASTIAKSVGSYYKNSIWTLYSFFISVFLIRVMSKSKDVLVTNEILFLFFAFAAITVLIINHAIAELEEDKQRFIDNYQSLKSRYGDLLIKEDLSRILESDKQHLLDIKYIDQKKSDYRRLWGCSLGIIFIAVCLLWLYGRSITI